MLLCALIASVTLSAQTAVPVTFAWDVDNGTPDTSAEIERDGVMQPCGSWQAPTPTERRCVALMPLGPATFRARMRNADSTSPWSNPLVAIVGGGVGSPPGTFTLTWHSPITLPSTGGGTSMSAFLQRNQATVFDGVVAYDSDVAAGSTLFAMISFNPALEVAVTGITDTRGNTWVADMTVTTGGGERTLARWRAANPTAGPNTITIAVSGTLDTQRVWVGEYSGVATASPLDRTASATGSSTTPSSGATATTTQANELVLGAFVTVFAGYVFTGPGGAWTDRSEVADERLNVIEQIATSTDTFTATGTYATSADWVATVITYRDAATGNPWHAYAQQHPAVQ